nr:hypothetical protein [Frankia nepalensis]
MPVPVTPPEGVRGVPAGADASNPRGTATRLPGVAGRTGGAIDGLPPFEAGPFDSYDGYDPAGDPTSEVTDWTTSTARQASRTGFQTPANGVADRAGTQDPGIPGPPTRGQTPPHGVDRPANTPPGLAVGQQPPGVSGDLAEELAAMARRLDELTRLRRHDVELVDRLHEENTRLRQGELTEAMGPLLRGLIRLHDQMSSLGADDPQSVAGILRKQLLQVLDISADVRPYIAVPGSPFDPARHLALRGVGTDEPGRDRTIARGVRPGFVRGQSTVLRPAEAEVYRHR